MKRKYVEPELELLKFCAEDIITTSTEGWETEDGGEGGGLLDD